MTRRRGYDVNLLSSLWTQSKSLSQEDRFVINIFLQHWFKELLKYCFSTLKCCKDSKRGCTLFVVFYCSLSLTQIFSKLFVGSLFCIPSPPLCASMIWLYNPSSYWLLHVLKINMFFTFFVLGPVEADDSIFEDHSSDNAARHLRKLPVRAHKLLRR